MKDHKDDEESGLSPLSGKAKRAGTLQLGEEKAQGKSYFFVASLMLMVIYSKSSALGSK